MRMIKKVMKIGNSLGVVIDKDVAEELQIDENSRVHIEITKED